MEATYNRKFLIELIHRKSHRRSFYQMVSLDGQIYQVDISEIKRWKGKKREPIRRPYKGMQALFILWGSKVGNRKLIVSSVDYDKKEAHLSEDGKDVPCKLIWNY